MSSAKLALVCGLLAIVLAACGNKAKPVAGSASSAARPPGRGTVDDPRAKHLKCLEQHHLMVVKVGQTGLQIGTSPSGPSISFQPTPGAAQELQIEGQVAGAEVIGSALLYPNQASEQELGTVEDCLAKGVLG